MLRKAGRWCAGRQGEASLRFIAEAVDYNIKGLVGSEMKWNLAVNEPFKNLKEYASLQRPSLALST